VQRFFTHKVDTNGWHTADLRRAIRNARRELLKEHDLAFVLSVADLVFSGSNNVMGSVHYLLGPMIVSKPVRVRNVFRWAKSDNRWLRRAACVSLIQGTRRGMFFPEIRGLAVTLLQDDDDMVQKGLGWLLRETAKANPVRAVPLLNCIRDRAPRLVLRTACETLPVSTRRKILTSSLAVPPRSPKLTRHC